MADDGPDPRREYPIVTVEHFPHGLACMDCARDIPEGYPFTERPDSVREDGSVTSVLVCVYCG